MEQLRAIDQIAYIRFASVYQSFEDLEDLKREVDTLYAEQGNGGSAQVSVLSDRDIRAALESGRVRIDPYDPEDLQPSSVDLHLDRALPRLPQQPLPVHRRPAPQPDLTELLTIEDDEPFILHPGEFVLGQTLEWVELPDDLVARLEGKSSLGRLGLLIHSTAGYVDPGWKGNLTLELSNVANLPIALYHGDADRPDQLLRDVVAGRAAVRVARPPVAVPGPVRTDRVGVPPGLRREGRGAPGPGRGHQRRRRLVADLGGGTRVALVQAGTFRSDAGTLFGPVPWVLWGDLVADEVDDERRLLQALNCLLIETPSGRVLVETGHRRAPRRQDPRDADLRGPVDRRRRSSASGSCPRRVDVVAMSHLHFDHAGGLLRADGERTFPHATIVAQKAEWEVALGDNPRLVASYVQPELHARQGLGRPGLGRRRDASSCRA